MSEREQKGRLAQLADAVHCQPLHGISRATHSDVYIAELRPLEQCLKVRMKCDAFRKSRTYIQIPWLQRVAGIDETSNSI